MAIVCRVTTTLTAMAGNNTYGRPNAQRPGHTPRLGSVIVQGRRARELEKRRKEAGGRDAHTNGFYIFSLDRLITNSAACRPHVHIRYTFGFCSARVFNPETLQEISGGETARAQPPRESQLSTLSSPRRI